MRQVDIAMLLIRQGDNYLLQLRDGETKIGAAGFIGCFGGKINKGEDPKAAVIREIMEETTLNPDHASVVEVGIVNVQSDYKNEPVKVMAHVFKVDAETSKRIKSKEGKLIEFTAEQAKSNITRLTPATKATFKEYIWH